MAVRQTYSYNDPATINYKLKGYSSDKLLLENLRTGADAKLDIVAKDRDGTDDSKVRLYSLGDSADANNQRLVIGWDKTKDAYQIKSAIDGTGVHKEIMLGMGPSDPSTTISIDNNFIVNNFINLGVKESVVISGGAITVTKSYVEVDTEGGVALDQLNTINGGTNSDLLFMRTTNNSRVVQVENSMGNILCGSLRQMDDIKDMITFLRFGSTWNMVAWQNNQ